MFGNVRILRVLFYVREEKEEMLVFSPLQRPKGMYIYCYPQDFCVLLAQSLENFTSQGVMHACFLILYLSWSSCISELLGKSSDYIWKRTR